jgi:TP901 family phage tail tape measure protein
MGRRITNLGAGLTKGITIPVAAMGAASVKNFGDVDKQMRLVQQTMGSTRKEAELLEKRMKTAASNSGFSMQDAADATLNFARQGFKASEAGNMLAPALNLAAATSTDLSVTTSGL